MLINNIEEIKKNIREWKKENTKIGLVPTMGALHKGHASLIETAKKTCDKVVVSVFVNPIQFGPNEDFDKYPRTIENDLELCKKLGVDIVFAPTPKEMYGENTKLSNTELTFVCPPYNLVDCLCGKARPGHFDGVATVVLKLFNIVKPDYAFFGQKDAQQLFILKKMVKDLNIDLTIVPCPIVRETDGLALSSRNTYLSKNERENALTISKALKEIEKLYNSGTVDTNILFDAGFSILNPNIELEYLEFRDFETFEKIHTARKNTLVAIAAKSGKTRLIDNIILG
ncbi:TPA: pantoate--beta-alanine ligase [Candidatus Avigastranaerophilus faecigallinarum]|nr:pantoate--beta-alanine ligase [Candidatus Avigastranaerophilus faecigallinarum]